MNPIRFFTTHTTHVPRSMTSRIYRKTIPLLLSLVAAGWVLTSAAVLAEPPGERGIPATVTGKLEVFHLDDFEHDHAEFRYLLEDAKSDRRFNLRFAGAPPGHLRSGATVTVRGHAKGQNIFLEADGDGDAGLEVVETTSNIVSGDRSTIVIVGNFADATVSCSIEDIRDTMFTDAANQSINAVYRESSFENTGFSGDVLGPYSLDAYSTDTGCAYIDWAEALDGAARTNGVEPDEFQHRVYVLPNKSGCPSGAGNLGGYRPRSWIWQCEKKDLYAHELGHNVSMHHAGTLALAGEYKDKSDFMGSTLNQLRQINGPHKSQMGWLPPDQQLTVTADGIYEISPLEIDPENATSVQLIHIPLIGTPDDYYLSYRRPIGFDANLDSSAYLDQATVHRWAGGSERTYLIDTLSDGEQFEDAINGVTVTQLSHSENSSTVEITLQTPACQSAIPHITVSPASETSGPGSTLEYSVSVHNVDDAQCTASTFNLASSIPNGWNETLAPATITLSPDQTGTATLMVTSAASSTDGDYGVTIHVNDATNPLHAMSGQVNYTVQAFVDTEAPTPPSNLLGSSKRKQVSLTWSTSNDNVAVSYYTVWRNNQALTQTIAMTYIDTSADLSQPNTYVVTASDEAGNASYPSNMVEINKGEKGGGKGGK